MNADVKIMRGNFGKLWINGEKVASLKSFEASVSAQNEDVHRMGDAGVYKRYVGFEGTGSFVCGKVNNRILKLLAKNWQQFVQPDIMIVAELDDIDVGRTTVKLTDVTFDNFNLLQFENKALGEENISFAFANYQIIDGEDL